MNKLTTSKVEKAHRKGGRKSRAAPANCPAPPTAKKRAPGAPGHGDLAQLAENLLAMLCQEFQQLQQETLTILDPNGRVKANPRVRGFVQLFTALKPFSRLLGRKEQELAGVLDAAVVQWSEHSD